MSPLSRITFAFLLLGSALSGFAQGTAASGVTATTVASTPTTFSFRAEELPIKQALALFARANNLNIIPDLDIEGTVTVEFRDLPLDLAMQALLEANGYYFKKEGALLRVKKTETRLFQVDYINVSRSGSGSNAVQISSGSSQGGGGSGGGGGGGGGGASGGSNNEGSSMTVTASSTINFWADLSEQIKSIISPGGSFTVNSLSGTVLIRDNHRNVEMIADYIESVTHSIVRQIDLEVEIYEVALNESSQLGINWQHVSDSLNTSFNALPGASTLAATEVIPAHGLLSSGGMIIQNPAYGPAPLSPAIRVASGGKDFQAVIDALKQQGTLKVVSKPRLRTLNNQPAVVRVGQDLPVFTTQVTITPGTNPIPTETETIQTVTVGTVLSITPQISSSGLITLDVTPAVSRLVRMERSSLGNNAPVVDIRQASSIVRLRDGATVIMGGLVQDSAFTTRRKVPLLGDIPVLGKAFTSKFDTSERTELVFFLTPRIINAEEEESAVHPVEKAVKTASN